jgi:hypothetical protein
MAAINVPRVAASALSKDKFISDYLIPNLPVVVTGVQLTEVPISFDSLRQSHGTQDVVVHSPSGDFTCTLNDYFDNFDEIRPLKEIPYLSDWSLPKCLPELLASLRIPNVWHDWRKTVNVKTQATERAFAYFFIGPAGVCSPLHSGSYALGKDLVLIETILILQMVYRRSY